MHVNAGKAGNKTAPRSMRSGVLCCYCDEASDVRLDVLNESLGGRGEGHAAEIDHVE